MLRTRLLLAAGFLLLPAPYALPDTLPPVDAPILVKGMSVNLDTVLRLTFERNADILAARERVNESQIAFNAAMQSCMPEMFRKDVFKTPAAEATLWRRRGELRKVEHDNLQDAANTYFDWLTASRGEGVARDLKTLEEKLLSRARKLAETEKPVQVIVEAIETATTGRQQYILQAHQQIEGVVAKLAYLMGMDGGLLTAAEILEPIDRVDTSVPVEVLVRQAQANGPGVQELQGLIASIQKSIAQARFARCICDHTGAALVCGRLQMAQSQLQQAQLALLSLQLRIRAGVEDAYSAFLSGRDQITQAAKVIEHASETYRLMDLRLNEEGPDNNIRNRTYEGVMNSIRQLSQAHSNYLTAVSNYNKAQLRLLLLLGNYANNYCPPNIH